ncbi:hypothetical protein PsorP6_017659 [Peronosclerospora sorghi]|uniref:Uncharacterized protein n=1 Tax=Peronosclerospora sorghi TaxID=230839 RepID=A0ACC0WM36_9STRA|nr:hypothetical protein PsorP6_017659 [Peronosclerospora sorghi]
MDRFYDEGLFPQRDCITLVCPVHDDNNLQQADALPTKDLRPEFQQQLREVKQIVYGESLQPKMAQGKPLNVSVTASECRKAMTTATETLKKSLSSMHLPLDDEALSKAIKTSEKQPLTYYHAASIGDKASDLDDNLLKRMEGVKSTCVRNNVAQSK